jgi:uncharacterized protein YodC (DUF2158 family)
MPLDAMFSIGDKVRLKSGGPVMEIIGIWPSRERAYCLWNPGDEEEVSFFGFASLFGVEPAQEAEPTEPPDQDERFRRDMETRGFRYRTRRWHEMPSLLDVLEAVEASLSEIRKKDTQDITAGELFDAVQPIGWLIQLLRMKRA